MSNQQPPAGTTGVHEDEALIARVAAGDDRALEALYDRYTRIVYSMAYRVLSSAELAEDIVQETFWRVWRRSSTYQVGRGQVMSWIFGIAHNLAIDELRRQRVRPSPVYETPERPILSEIEDQQSDVLGSALEQERRQLINEALGEIPDEQREVLELAYFSGLSQSEIADQLQKPIGTIKTRARLGLQKLRDILSARGLRVEDLGS